MFDPIKQYKLIDNLQKLISSQPKNFAIRKTFAEKLIIQYDLTGKLEAWPHFQTFDLGFPTLTKQDNVSKNTEIPLYAPR